MAWHGIETGHSLQYSINTHAYTNCNGRLAPQDLLTNGSVSMGSYPKRAGPNMWLFINFHARYTDTITMLIETKQVFSTYKF